MDGNHFLLAKSRGLRTTKLPRTTATMPACTSAAAAHIGRQDGKAEGAVSRRALLTSIGLATRALQQEFGRLMGSCAGKTALYIPTAGLGSDWPSRILSQRAGQLQSFGFREVRTIDIAQVQGEQLQREFEELQPSCIYLDVGNTYYLLHHLRSSGADKLITQAADEGVLLLGASAGSICLGETAQIGLWKDWDDRTCKGIEDVWQDWEKARGLQLLGGRSIFPHAQDMYASKQWQDEQRRKHGHDDLAVIPLTNGEGVVIDGDEVRMVV